MGLELHSSYLRVQSTSFASRVLCKHWSAWSAQRTTRTPCASSIVKEAPVCRAIDSRGNVASHPLSSSISMRRPLEMTSVRPTARSWSAICFAYVGSAGASLGWGACIDAMYWIARSCTCSGIVMVTVGFDVGTGRGGMTRPGVEGAASGARSAGAGVAEADVLADALSPASGPLVSHAVPTASATIDRPRIIGGF
jgi:hypothetical protein